MTCCATRRDIFLKIEPVTGYSPLSPDPCARRWGRDEMFNMGHELGRVQASEIVATTLDALVYHEYFDSHHTKPNTAKLIEADVNEPAWNRRIPGCVLYARPGERLYIHVLNGDKADCHSFHVHGVRYGIESDGAWPFGTRTRSGRRSDEIRPGESWTYVFDVTEETIGVWPFHDHVRHVNANVNRGLFGALIVRDPAARRVDHEIPLFVHQVQGLARVDTFQSPLLGHGGVYTRQFDTPATIGYYCKVHGASMAGTVVVDPAAPAGNRAVAMGDNFFNPASTSVQPGASVTWTNNGNFDHIVFAPGGGAPTFCLNGRAYVGNTPTIEVTPGERLRWYLANTDLSSAWHNFHPHSTRWRLPAPPAGAADVHALSPAESFVIDTEAPPALRLPCELERLQCDPPAGACRVAVKGDYLFHCHIEDHMMAGLAGLIRSRDSIWVTTDILNTLDLVIPFDGRRNETGWVDLTRCGSPCPTGKHPHDDRPHHPSQPPPPQPPHGPHAHVAAAPAHGPAGPAPSVSASHVHPATLPAATMTSMGMMPTMPGMPEALDVCHTAQEGYWELLHCDSRVLAVHAVLMHTGKVLFFAGSGNNVPNFTAHDMRGVVWDYQAGTFHTPLTPFDVFCAGQTILPDGKVLVAGGTEQYDPFIGLRSSWLFDPIIEEWIRVGDMRHGRWYPSLVTLGDGRAIAVSGIAEPSEIYSPMTGWSLLPRGTDLPLYPHLLLLADGRVFFTGGQIGQAVIDARTIDPLSAAETIVPGLRDQGNRDQGPSVLLPPAQDQKVMILGGGGPSVATNHTDIVDLKAASPHYVPGPDMKHARGLHNCVILPDRTVLVSGGGLRGETRADAVHEAEIYDPAANTFRPAGTQLVSRLYHSVALLLPDGRVITAGSNPDRGDDELRLELYHPPYLFRGPRPFIESTPRRWFYGTHIGIHTPHASEIKWAHIIRPLAVTHSDDTSQRLVDLPIGRRDVCHLHVSVPENPNLAPPGWYLLFLCDKSGIPSNGEWIHLDRTPVERATPPKVKPPDKHLHTHDHNPGFPIPGFPRKREKNRRADVD